MDLVSAELSPSTLVVAVDPGKASNRVMRANGERGLLADPISLSSTRERIERLARMVESAAAPKTVIALEATGSLHHAWAVELERRCPGALRLSAPSETVAARSELGSRRFKDDDRDCAALVSLARQGRGRPAREGILEALLDGVRHRRRLIFQTKVIRQHLHHQLNAVAPGFSAPAGHGRALALETSTGRAVLACAVAFAGRAPRARSLLARAPGRLLKANAEWWAARWRECLPPPPEPSCAPSVSAGTLRAGGRSRQTSLRSRCREWRRPRMPDQIGPHFEHRILAFSLGPMSCLGPAFAVIWKLIPADGKRPQGPGGQEKWSRRQIVAVKPQGRGLPPRG